MTERERLIELINDCRSMEGYGIDLVERQADYLLANSVILPPVKVGQKVYSIPRSAIREWTVCGVWVSADPKCSYAHISYEKNGHPWGSCAVKFSDINSTLFLTREEAEKGLAERMKDNG